MMLRLSILFYFRFHKSNLFPPTILYVLVHLQYREVVGLNLSTSIQNGMVQVLIWNIPHRSAGVKRLKILTGVPAMVQADWSKAG